MPDNIFGNRVVLFREPAWHNLGRVYAEAIDPVQAVRDNGLDYTVYVASLQAMVPVMTPLGPSFDYEPVPVETDCAIMREPTSDDPQWRQFGRCSKTYQVVQNVELASALTPLIEKWPVETIGALGKGETFFMTLSAGEREFHGEGMKDYFIFADTKDGKTTARFAFTPVRIVCANTLASGLKQATMTANMPHYGNLAENISFRVDLLKRAQKAQEAVYEHFDIMTRIALSNDDVESLLAEVYPHPMRPRAAALLDEPMTPDEVMAIAQLYNEATQAETEWKVACSRANSLRAQVRELYGRFNDEAAADLHGTGYGLFNAVVESADYRKGASSKSVAASTLFGPRAAEKARAFQAVMRLAK